MIALVLALLAVPDLSPTVPNPAPVCTTPEACHFLDLALSCEGKLDEALRKLEGETQKVQTASASCSLQCAACPACECGSGWMVGFAAAGGALGGVLGGALLCATR